MTQVLRIKKGILFKAFAGLFEVSSLKIEKSAIQVRGTIIQIHEIR